MEDRLAQFLFTNYVHKESKVRPSVPSIPGLADAVIEVNGLFVESKVPLRSRVISLYSEGTENSKICHVSLSSVGSWKQSFADLLGQALDNYSATLGIPLERRLPEPSDNKYSDLKTYINKIDGSKFKFLLQWLM